MSIFRRPPADPELERARAEAAREQARADLERARAEAQLQREQQEAHAEFTRRQAQADEQERRRRDTVRRAEQVERRDRNRKARAEFTAKLRPVLPLLLINGGAAYAQAAYAYAEIAPAEWTAPSKVVFALAFALALESIAVYVQWHAHDALLLRAHATAASLRRASWGIAAVVGAINYAHFANGWEPTAASVAFALLSLLSPWLWGLHTRRAQHVQLLAEDANLIDEGGVEFSPQRRRAFPIRSWNAKRWSIDNGEQDPRKAWEGYNAERLARKAAQPLPVEHRRPSPLLLAAGLACTVAGFAAPGFLYGLFTWAAVGLNTLFVLLWLHTSRASGTAQLGSSDRPAPEPVAVEQDNLAAIVDAVSAVAAEPATVPAPATYRPRWRPSSDPSPRRMRRPQPQIIVNLPEPKPTRKAPEPAAKSPTSAAGRGRPSSAQKVASFAAKNPDLTVAELAQKLKVSADTIRRHLPKQTAAVNGHDHTVTN